MKAISGIVYVSFIFKFVTTFHLFQRSKSFFSVENCLDKSRPGPGKSVFTSSERCLKLAYGASLGNNCVFVVALATIIL